MLLDTIIIGVSVLKAIHALTIAMLILGGIGFLYDDIGEIVGPIEYNGYLGFSFDGIETTVHTVDWIFEEEIGTSLIIVEVPAGWTYSVSTSSVTLSRGALAPGEHLQVQVSFKRYVEPGDRPLNAVGQTSDGETLAAEGVLEVATLNLLKVLEILNSVSIPLIGGGILSGIGSLFWPKKPASTTTTHTTGEDEPTETPTTIDEPIEQDTELLGCQISYSWMHQVMDLTVAPGGDEGAIIRTLPDDPMPLKAIGYDRHYLIHECICPKTGSVSRQSYLMFAHMRYTWEIIEGLGGFLDINDENQTKTDEGEQVLFMPPNIVDPEKKEKIVIKVTGYHIDDTKPPDHDPVIAYLDIEITREITEEGETTKTDTEYTDPGEIRDEYLYKFNLRKQLQIGNPPPSDMIGDCIPEKEWQPATEISGSIVYTPREVVYGDFVRLKAAGGDTDDLVLSCTPQGEDGCIEGSGEIVTVNDNLIFTWSADKGSFPQGNTGRECIWHAPDEAGQVRIKLTIRDKGEQFTDDIREDKAIITVLKQGIDLVKAPKEWMPDAVNGTFRALATTYLCREGKWTAPGRRKYVRFKLTKVSREKGVCLNYPKEGNKNPDLFYHEEHNRERYLQYHDETDTQDCPTEILLPGDNPAHQKHHLYAVSKRMENTAEPVIRVEDYGATGQLSAAANHCVAIPPRKDVNQRHENCKEGSNTIELPLDENNNDIADGALQDLNGAPANQDDDPRPTGQGNGDGLTNYEEYRGFIVGGVRNIAAGGGLLMINIPLGAPKQHIRTDARKKDVFVYDADLLGTGMLNVTGLDIHILYLEDLFNGTDKREINFNHGRHHGGLQHGLWLRDQNMPGLYGRSCGVGNGPPKNKTHVCINVSVNTAAGEPPNRLSNSIGHELCHGLNIWHHGEGGNHNCSDPGWNFTANTMGRLTSGNINCIMRYDQYAVAWCHGAHHTHRYANLTALPGGAIRTTYNDPVGTLLCTNSAGTGLNNAGAGHINNATRGNCQGQLKVKDW